MLDKHIKNLTRQQPEFTEVVYALRNTLEREHILHLLQHRLYLRVLNVLLSKINLTPEECIPLFTQTDSYNLRLALLQQYALPTLFDLVFNSCRPLEYQQVKRAAILHPKCPTQYLKRVLYATTDSLRQYAVKNSNLPQVDLEHALRHKLMGAYGNPQCPEPRLRETASHDNLRETVLSNPGCPPDILEQEVAKNGMYISSALANQNFPTDGLRRCWKRQQWFSAIIVNPSCPVDVLLDVTPLDVDGLDESLIDLVVSHPQANHKVLVKQTLATKNRDLWSQALIHPNAPCYLIDLLAGQENAKFI